MTRTTRGPTGRTRRVVRQMLVNARPRLRNWGAKTNVAFIFTSLAAVLVVAAFLTAFVVRPPALGWVGFAIVSAAVAGLGAVATLVLPRLRVSAPKPATAVDADRRLLVVADASSSAKGLFNEITAGLDGAVAVHLVVPVRVSHLHFLTNDEAEEQREAEQTMLIVVGLLRQARNLGYGFSRQRQAARVDDRRAWNVPCHPRAACDPTCGGVVLAGTRPAGQGAGSDRAPDHTGDRRLRSAGALISSPGGAGRGRAIRVARAALGTLGDERPAEVEPTVADLRLGKGPLLDARARSEQVDDVDLPCREQIGDQPSVAAPGERLGAHEAWALSAQGVREGPLPFARGHPRGIASERGDTEAPESVLSGNARTTAAEARRVHVGDGGGLQLDGQRRLAELRIAP